MLPSPVTVLLRHPFGHHFPSAHHLPITRYHALYVGCLGVMDVQVSTAYMSTRPVLQCLQKMFIIPLAEELLHVKEPMTTTYLNQTAANTVSISQHQQHALEI
jgi:hypothetical protein